jgi:hypothetical protein
MANITCSQYWTEVKSIAECLVSESAIYTECNTAESFDQDTIRDHIFDSALHEAIDSHQWVIYYAYNLDVLQHSDNAEYGIDHGIIDASESIKAGLSTLHCHLAFWALYADVCDYIDDAIAEYESNLTE